MGAYWLRRIVDRYGCMSSFHRVLVKQTMKTITVNTFVSTVSSVFSYAVNALALAFPVAATAAVFA